MASEGEMFDEADRSREEIAPDRITLTYYIYPTDTVTKIHIQPILNGSNYLQWSKIFYTAVAARRKVGFLRGSIKEPAPEDIGYDDWHTCSGLVLSWLVHSVNKRIANTIYYFSNVSEVWSTLKTRYSVLE